MMQYILSSACLTIGLFVLPLLYLLFCLWMKLVRVPTPPYFPFFLLFGTCGGWFLAFALSPSGLGAASLLFLFTLAPASLLFSSVRLWQFQTVSTFHKSALYGSVGYLILLVAWLAFLLIANSLHLIPR